MATTRTKKSPNKKPTKKSSTKPSKQPPRKPTKPTARPKKSIYDDYLGNAASNAKAFGLTRALEICVDMFTYEFQRELKKLKQAAIAGLAAKDFAPIVVLAKAHGIKAFTEADAETMLRGLAEADDHFTPMQE